MHEKEFLASLRNADKRLIYPFGIYAANSDYVRLLYWIIVSPPSVVFHRLDKVPIDKMNIPQKNRRQRNYSSLKKSAFLIACLLTAPILAEDTAINNLNDTDNPASITVDGTLTLTNSANTSFGLDGKSVTATGLAVQAGESVQTLTGALNVGATGATISTGTLNLSGTAASLDSAGTVAISDGAKLLFTGAVPHNTVNPLTININEGGTLEFTNMGTGDHVAENSLTVKSAITTKGITITGDGTFLKTGTGKISTTYQTGGGTPKFALSAKATIDVQSGTFLNGGWNNQNWNDNYSKLNIGSTGIVDIWDGNIMQVSGLTGDAGGKIVSGAGSGDAARGGIKIGVGTTADQAFTYNGVVSLTNANSKFIKMGAGTQTITGAFSNSGTTTIESGVLNATNSFTSATTTIKSGTLNVTGAFSNSGTTTIDSGVLNATGSFSSKTTTINSGTLNVTGTSSSPGTTTVGSGGTLNLSGAVTLTSLTLADNATFDLSGATSVAVNGVVDLKDQAYTLPSLTGSASGDIQGTGTLTLTAIAGTQTYSGKISGDRAVIYNPGSANPLVLSGQSTFTGGLTVSGGILRVGAATTLNDSGAIVSGPLGTGTVTLENGTIQNHGDSNYEYASPEIVNPIVISEGKVGSIRSGWSGKMITLKGLISGAGQLQLANDSSSVTISHENNTYSGGTKIGGGINSTTGQGTLILGANEALGTGELTFGTKDSSLNMNGFNETVSQISGGNGTITNASETLSTLTLDSVTGGITYSGKITGNVKLVLNETSNAPDTNYLNLSGANTHTGGTEIKAGVIRLGVGESVDGTTGAIISSPLGTGTVTLSGGIIQNATDAARYISNNITLTEGTIGTIKAKSEAGIVTIQGLVSGSGQLQIDGSGMVILAKQNTHTGGTIIKGGITRLLSKEVLNDSGALVSGPLGMGTLTLAGGTIQNKEDNVSPTISNDIVLADGTASSFRAGWTDGVITLTGLISGSGQLQIANDSSSVAITHANNTYSGGTKIGGGINGYTGGQGKLILGADEALGTGVVSFGSNNSTLQLAGFNQTFGGLDNSNGSGGFYSGNSIINTVNGTATAIDLKLNVADGANYAYSGSLPVLTSITKTGAGKQVLRNVFGTSGLVVEGTLELGGTGTLTGTLTGAGNLVLNNTNPAGESTYNIDGSAFTGTIEIASGIVQVTNTAMGSGQIILSGGTLKNNSNSPTITNDILLADGTASSIRSGWTGFTITLSGLISGSGSLELANDGSAVKITHANNTYSGGTKIGGGKNSWTGDSHGTLILGAENALGTGVVTFGSNNSTLQLAGFNQTIGGLDNTGNSAAADGYFTGVSISNSGSDLTLTLDVEAGKTYSWNGTINQSETITLVKTGDGIQKFASFQTFAGTTIKEGGIMLSGDNVAISGPLTVETGAFITTDPEDGVFHTIDSDGIGTDKGDLLITISSPTTASRFALDGAPTFDPEAGFIDLGIAEDVKLSSSAAFTVSNINPSGETDLETWLLPDWRYEWNLNWNEAGASMTLQRDSAAVPEPSSWVLLILGALGSVCRFFQKQKRNRSRA